MFPSVTTHLIKVTQFSFKINCFFRLLLFHNI